MNSTETTPSSGLGSRTKSMLVIMGIIGAVIIGVLLVYGILVTPQRQPYRDALAQYENVERANAALTVAGANLNANKATDEAFEENIETAQAAVTSLNTEIEALGKEEVLTNGEGKDRYDAFVEKMQTYMTYNETILASMLKVRPVLYDCNQKMANISESAASVTAIRDCAAQLDQLENISDSDYAQLVNLFKQQYRELALVIEQMATLKDSEGTDTAQYKTLEGQRTQIINDVSTTSSDFARSVQQHRQQILPTDASKGLEDYLKNNARIF